MNKVGVALMVTMAAASCHKNEDAPAFTLSPSASSARPALSMTTATLAGPFEGEIVVNVKDESAQKLPSSIVYDVKGDKVRYFAAAAHVRAIEDTVTHHAYAVDDGQKAYRDLDAQPIAGKTVTAKVTKTGKMEKIAGTDCENWTIDTPDEKADVCVAKSVAFFEFAPDPKPGSVESPWAATLTSEKAFPLRVVMHDKNGKEQFRTEAVSVVRKNLDDASFQLPTGFKKSDLDVKLASLP